MSARNATFVVSQSTCFLMWVKLVVGNQLRSHPCPVLMWWQFPMSNSWLRSVQNHATLQVLWYTKIHYYTEDHTRHEVSVSRCCFEMSWSRANLVRSQSWSRLEQKIESLGLVSGLNVSFWLYVCPLWTDTEPLRKLMIFGFSSVIFAKNETRNKNAKYSFVRKRKWLKPSNLVIFGAENENEFRSFSSALVINMWYCQIQKTYLECDNNTD